MASLEAIRYADMLRHSSRMVEMQLSEQRAAGEHAEDLTTLPVGISYQNTKSEGIAGLWAIPEHDKAGHATVYLFGGGHVISSVQSRRKFAGHLANVARCPVLIADYRLAPEHQFPADVEDAAAAYKFLLGEGYSPRGIAIGGESSAGGLTMSTLFALRDAGLALPAGAFLLSPWIDSTCAAETHVLNRAVDLTATTAGLRRMAGQYLGDTD